MHRTTAGRASFRPWLWSVAAFATCVFARGAAADPAPPEALRAYLAPAPADRPPLDRQAFASVPLSRADAEAAGKLLWEDHAKQIRLSRVVELKDRTLNLDGKEMPFYYDVFGDKPAGGRSLFISMHGGGNAAKAVNDRQWENQKRLYKPAEGVYLAPRAPTNTWNLWHEPHIDDLFGRLIEDLVVLEGVDPNRVYLMGYSAGGDGVFQLAPRTADRWAAAAMMAGHPNDALPQSLRNLPFTAHVGGKDAAFNRNTVVPEWGRKLDELEKADPGGYVHLVKVHPDKPHWMDREDAEAVPWMARYTRNPIPNRVVWKQDDVTHARFYWLAVDVAKAKAGDEVTASYAGQEIKIESTDVDRLTIRLNDRMMDLDRPVTASWRGKQAFQGTVPRTAAVLEKTLRERGDPAGVFCAELEVRRAGTE